MVGRYKASPEILDAIRRSFDDGYYCFTDDIDVFKQSYIDGIKNNATGFWNPADERKDGDIVHSDEYTLYKFNTSDNRSRLEIHLQDEFGRQKLEEFGWLVNGQPIDIEYKINQFGFRCNNFTDAPGIVYVGCSNTYGTGMLLNDIWPTLVSSYFNLESWNLGAPGMGLTTGTFYLMNWPNDIPNPKAIIVLEPPPNRLELYYFKHDRLKIDILKHILDEYKQNILVHSLYERLPFTAAINYRLNIQALKLLAKQWNVPLISKTLFSNSLSISSAGSTDYARDLMHFGKNVHASIAENMIQALKNEGL